MVDVVVIRIWDRHEALRFARLSVKRIRLFDGNESITLAVDEKILAGARRYASERDRSVNSLVRDFLAEIASREDRVKTARERIRQMSLRSNARIGAAKWSREDLHER